jgi:YidC/Oxa1 family membrane protein insertase
VADSLARIFSPLATLISSALELFHSLGAPWWLSIVVLTVSVRAALFPLTYRQVRNMRTMQELKPEMDEIRARFKGDRQKQQEAMMTLYRERRVNPLAGFLPILVQVPVFITMYQVVRSHEETFPSFASGGLLWFTDLTKPDPYLMLPLLSASILVLAGEVSGRNIDPAQRRMMRFVPLVFTALIARFPAGLFVYWVSSNTVTLLQNMLIYRRIPGRSRLRGLLEDSDSSGRKQTTPPEDRAGPAATGQDARKKRERHTRKRKKKRR